MGDFPLIRSHTYHIIDHDLIRYSDIEASSIRLDSKSSVLRIKVRRRRRRHGIYCSWNPKKRGNQRSTTPPWQIKRRLKKGPLIMKWSILGIRDNVYQIDAHVDCVTCGDGKLIKEY
ncbi:hypothetical protein DY000_02017247 [Brassica cretica]|uniref:Uncharacterized protein n=1 Tax=Brassica cretica TaxID=69181 RepID=A0ABQ7D973_BRACR|nr:hypothetical protein DY000_02017247 [Brassica cretica]